MPRSPVIAVSDLITGVNCTPGILVFDFLGELFSLVFRCEDAKYGIEKFFFVVLNDPYLSHDDRIPENMSSLSFYNPDGLPGPFFA